MYCYLWKYRVKKEFIQEFKEIYSGSGKWAELFSLSEGYKGTELFVDAADENIMITIDYWADAKSRSVFMENYKTEYSKLDEHCSRFTEEETFTGEFEKAAIL